MPLATVSAWEPTATTPRRTPGGHPGRKLKIPGTTTIQVALSTTTAAKGTLFAEQPVIADSGLTTNGEYNGVPHISLGDSAKESSNIPTVQTGTSNPNTLGTVSAGCVFLRSVLFGLFRSCGEAEVLDAGGVVAGEVVLAAVAFLGWVRPGRPAGITPGGFPRPARRVKWTAGEVPVVRVLFRRSLPEQGLRVSSHPALQ
jgi:hypothetical protein